MQIKIWWLKEYDAKNAEEFAKQAGLWGIFLTGTGFNAFGSIASSADKTLRKIITYNFSYKFSDVVYCIYYK